LAANAGHFSLNRNRGTFEGKYIKDEPFFSSFAFYTLAVINKGGLVKE